MGERSQGNIETFRGKPVVVWHPQKGHVNHEVVYKIMREYGSPHDWKEIFDLFCQGEQVSKISDLVVGTWWGDETWNDESMFAKMVEAFTARADRLPALRHLYIGDISSEECEISWLELCDISPLLKAYPRLETLHIQGTNGLRFPAFRSDSLRELMIMSGGLNEKVIEDLLDAELPQLEHLELYLGIEDYGGISTIDDLLPLLSKPFPSLKYLGLKNSQLANEIASALTSSPLLLQVETLDLSLGLLDDTGAETILSFPPLPKLRKLDLQWHYCSDEMMERLTAFAVERGISLDVSEQMDSECEYDRYVSIAE